MAAAMLTGCAQQSAPSACVLDPFTVKALTAAQDVSAVPSPDGAHCDYLFVGAVDGNVSGVQVDRDPALALASASPPAASPSGGQQPPLASEFSAGGHRWRVEVSATGAADPAALADSLAALVAAIKARLGDST